MSHHYQDMDPEIRKMFQDIPKLGATGKFPDGKLTEKDEGELQFAVGNKDNRILIEFGKPIRSLGMTKQEALKLAELLCKQANAIL